MLFMSQNFNQKRAKIFSLSEASGETLNTVMVASEGKLMHTSGSVRHF